MTPNPYQSPREAGYDSPKSPPKKLSIGVKLIITGATLSGVATVVDLGWWRIFGKAELWPPPLLVQVVPVAAAALELLGLLIVGGGGAVWLLGKLVKN